MFISLHPNLGFCLGTVHDSSYVFLFVFENQTYTTYSHMQITCTIKKWRALCLGNKTNLVNGGIHQCKTKCTMGLPFLQLSAANVYQRHIIHVQNTSKHSVLKMKKCNSDQITIHGLMYLHHVRCAILVN